MSKGDKGQFSEYLFTKAIQNKPFLYRVGLMIVEVHVMDYSKKGTKKKQDELSSKGQKKKKKGVFIFKIVLIVIIVLVLAVGVVGAVTITNIMKQAPQVDVDDISPIGYKTIILDSNGNEIQELVTAGSNREKVALDQIPVDLQHAFVAIEDERFYEHNGIDFKSIARAAVEGITSGFHFSQGGSTITQQLLKNTVFDGWETETKEERWTRKFQEWYLATEIEKAEGVTKDVILEKYLNVINLGQNTLGVQAAANRYFDKDVSELTLSECAVIAGITKNPSAYNPISYPETNKERRDLVLHNMLEQGYISQAEYDEAIADDVYSRIQVVDNEVKNESSVNSYFVDALIDDVLVDLQEIAGYTEEQAKDLLYSGGLTIYSTQDMGIQEICDEEASDPENYDGVVEYSFDYALSVEAADGKVTHYDHSSLREWFRVRAENSTYSIVYKSQEEAQEAIDTFRENIVQEGDTILGERVTFTLQPQIAFTVMDQHTGHVVAMVGGRGEKTASRILNRATSSKNQPGSAAKIYTTYAPALESGEYTLATAVDDEPYAYADSDKVIRNDNGKYGGLTPVREAIVESTNIVAVKTLTDISVQTGMDYARKFGITTLTNDDFGQQLALGGTTNGVYNDELTAAFATIANGGIYTEPILYTKILDHDGDVLIENIPETREVIKPTTAFLLTDAMQDVITRGTGKIAYFDGMSIAGKTGTTTGTKATWFVGFTPYYTCAVWGGNDDNTSVYDNDFSRVIWREVMSRIHEDMENVEFERPDGLTRVTVCSKTGLLPVEGLCPDTHTEYFVKGTAPNKECDLHQKVKICKDSLLLANEFCPLESVEEKVLLVDANEKTADKELMIPEETCAVHNELTYQQQIQNQLQDQLQNMIPGQNQVPGQSQTPSQTQP